MQGMAKKMPQRQSAGRAQKAPQQAPKQGKKMTGALGKLYNLPVKAGIAALVLLCVLALPVGNMRALQNATPKDFIRWGDVESIVEDRLDAAGNVITAASRADGVDEQVALLEETIEGMRPQDTAQQISRYDQQLQTQVTALADAARDGLDAEGQTMLQRALDDFTEQGNFLRQEARDFNDKADKAVEIYESLPLRALFVEPDYYEGI